MVIEPWNFPPPGIPGPMPEFRQAQHAALALQNVGYATATDVGDPLSPWISVHPRNKKLIGRRLASAALNISYGVRSPYGPWRCPQFRSQRGSVNHTTGEIVVDVTLAYVPTTLVPRTDHCEVENGVPAAACAGFEIWNSMGDRYNATASISADGKRLILRAGGAVNNTCVEIDKQLCSNHRGVNFNRASGNKA